GAKEFGWATSLDDLRDLDLSDNGLSEEGARLLAQAPALQDLLRLDLSDNQIRDEGVAHLAEAPFGRLRELRLAKALVGTAAGRALAGAEWAGSLAVLDLGDNHLVGDETAKLLAAAGSLAGLRELHLNGAPITDLGAKALAESPHFGRLLVLSLK